VEGFHTDGESSSKSWMFFQNVPQFIITPQWLGKINIMAKSAYVRFSFE